MAKRLARTDASRRGRARWGAAATALVLAASMAPSPALAAVTAGDVAGLDYVYPGLDGTEVSGGAAFVDVLSVTGEADDTIYVDLLDQDGRTMASHLAYSLGENGTRSDTGRYVGVLSLDSSGISPSRTYAIRAWADRGETELLYEGTVTFVFAQLEGEANPRPVAVRTASAAEERPTAAPAQIALPDGKGGATLYERESDAPATDDKGRVVYAYRLADSAPEEVTAHVSYYSVDDPKTPIKVDEYAVKKGEGVTATVPKIVQAGGAWYRTLQVGDSVRLSYPGATEVSVMCANFAFEGAEGIVGADPDDPAWQPYAATVTYVDAEGNPLGAISGLTEGNAGLTDSLVVSEPYLYVPPMSVYVTAADGTVEAWELVDADTRLLFTFPKGETEASVAYRRVSESGQRRLVVNYVDGVNGGTIKTVTLSGAPGEQATHELDATVSVNGAEYVPASVSAGGQSRPVASDADRTITHTFSQGTDAEVITAYYVPSGYVAPEAYQITVNFTNVADNQVIRTQTLTCEPSMRSDLVVEVPAEFAEGGVQWVRLNGQNDTLTHSFYSPTRTYTVFYRDVNDDLHERTVVETVRTVYDEVVTYTTTTTTAGTTTTTGTTTAPATTTTTPATPATPTEPAAPGATDATPVGRDTGGEAQTVVTGEDGGTPVDGTGTPTEPETITDDANPQAAAPQAGQASQLATGAIIALVGAIAAAIAALFFVWRKKDEAEQDK